MPALYSPLAYQQTVPPLYSVATGPQGDESASFITRPTLVFLHGLLGSTEDWRHIVAELSTDYQCICIDLPGHAISQAVTVTDFQHVQQLIISTLEQYHLDNIILVGYSLGARIAMTIACEQVSNWPFTIDGILLESGNPGLNSSAEQLQRGLHDLAWVTRFNEEPLPEVLIDWYQQGVFSSLTSMQKAILIDTRCQIQADCDGFKGGAQISKMLAATSLSKQHYLLPKLQSTAYPVRMICGDLDPKFQQLTQASQLDYRVVSKAGHNVHADKPAEFSLLVRSFVADATYLAKNIGRQNFVA